MGGGTLVGVVGIFVGVGTTVLPVYIAISLVGATVLVGVGVVGAEITLTEITFLQLSGMVENF